MRTTMKMLTVLRAAAGGGVAYLLRDEFTTARTTVDGTDAEPGPGQRHVAANSGDNLSIADGDLILTTAVGTTDPALYWTDADGSGFPREAGLTLLFNTEGGVFAGWSKSTTPAEAALAYGVTGRDSYRETVVSDNTVLDGDLRHALVLLDTGAIHLYKYENDWLLARVWDDGADTTLWPMLLGAAATYRQVAITRAGAAYRTRNGIRVDGKATGVQGDTFTCPTDGAVSWIHSATGSNVTRMAVRMQSATNYVRAQIVSGTLSLSRIVLDAVNKNYFTGVAVANGARVELRFYDATLQVFVNGVKQNEYSGSDVYDDGSTGAKIVRLDAGASVTDLDVWPWVAPTDSAFSAHLTGQRFYGVIGDSKSNSSGAKFQPFLTPLLEGESGANWSESFRSALAGRTVATEATLIDADLAAHSGGTPEAILSNFGANDVNALPNEATWKANYLYILDAVHAKWPDATVYIMRPWKQGEDADCDTLASWIADIVAARDFTELGPDERDFLEGGDDGATHTSDGTHPNTAGRILTAREWANVLGF